MLTGGKITRYAIKQSQARLYLSVLDRKQNDGRTHGRNKRSIADLVLERTPMRPSWLGHMIKGTFIGHQWLAAPCLPFYDRPLGHEPRAIGSKILISVRLGLCVKMHSRRYEVNMRADVRGNRIFIARNMRRRGWSVLE
jgi:hypothetical protein